MALSAHLMVCRIVLPEPHRTGPPGESRVLPRQVLEGGGRRVVVGLGGGAPEQAGLLRTEVQSVRICHSLQILSWQVLVVSGFSRCWQR